MNSAYAEKEREFVAGLAEDTGRDLAGWMTAIAESGHTERNDIIDWLRHQGFQFAWASWLERIHHNGGRLIYADTLPDETRPANRAAVDREQPRSHRRVTRPVRSGPSSHQQPRAARHSKSVERSQRLAPACRAHSARSRPRGSRDRIRGCRAADHDVGAKALRGAASRSEKTCVSTPTSDPRAPIAANLPRPSTRARRRFPRCLCSMTPAASTKTSGA